MLPPSIEFTSTYPSPARWKSININSTFVLPLYLSWLVMATVKTKGLSSSFGSMHLKTNCKCSSKNWKSKLSLGEMVVARAMHNKHWEEMAPANFLYIFHFSMRMITIQRKFSAWTKISAQLGGEKDEISEWNFIQGSNSWFHHHLNLLLPQTSGLSLVAHRSST